MDVVDRASQEEENVLAIQIRLATKVEHKLVPNGKCFYCDEEVQSPKLFCNAFCSEDHEKEVKLKKRLGKYNAK